jgi:hypothetical protein
MTVTEWLTEFLREQNLDWEKLSPGERTSVLIQIPCNVRCWRVGGAVDTTPGKPCPECGSPVPIPTVWEHFQQDSLKPV